MGPKRRGEGGRNINEKKGRRSVDGGRFQEKEEVTQVSGGEGGGDPRLAADAVIRTGRTEGEGRTDARGNKFSNDETRNP